MFTTRKTIDSKSRWLLTVCILPLCLAAPATASSVDLTAQANHLLLPSQGLAADEPDVLIPKPPPPPPFAVSSADLAARASHLLLPSQVLAADEPDVLIPKPPPPPPFARV